ncbi:MAG: glycerol-3-phosphate dehydrogenase/oxidase [Myxococcota bacterium]
MAPPSPSASPDRQRQETLARVARDGVDLVIVGGGITGAGAARDATLRGLRVLLLDKGDWANGTSSRSSKLVHGGLRYLETFKFGLVMEGTRERHRQLRLNPHLVSPLPFLMPVWKDGRHGLGKINLGLWLYDMLSLFRTPKLHKKLSPAKTLAEARALRADNLAGGILYYDCRTDDARLTLANVLDAERRGAATLAYARYDGPVFGDDGRIARVKVHDLLTGSECEVACSSVLCATGPWTDVVGKSMGEEQRLRPTKGVHIVVARERLPIDLAVAVSSVDDGRVVFVIPFGNTTYVGTTDTDYTGDLENVYATSDDVDYLLRTANHFFPGSDLVAGDIRSTWAGLRPLIKSDAATAYKTSREHEIYLDPRGIVTIAGGKLTTYRAMAEQVVDKAIHSIQAIRRARKQEKLGVARCKTHKVPLDGATATVAASPGLAELAGPATDQGLDEILWRTHGSLAEVVRERMRSHPAEARPIVPDLPYVMAEVAIAALYEQAWHLEDMLVRRLQVSLRAADCGVAAARPVAELMASVLGRDAAWVDAEVSAYLRHVDLSRACVAASAGPPRPLAQSA